MKRFVAPCTIVGGQRLAAHITTLDDAGRLLAVEPFEKELAGTRYCPGTLRIEPADDGQCDSLRHLIGRPVKLMCDDATIAAPEK
ncbi:MAG: hypothetical protein IJ632_08295 [Muribaculaceae bacterium]|nr:hypothetical protein [Muribaculaceae bacterium]